ncbi:MAG: hypothetical protein GX321_05545 [Clostridiales bacterium]|nr:hypothetical protein [Clostridiales bacterium]
MAEVIKTYKQSVPAMRFIGKKYCDEDRVDGGFGKQWGEWFSNGWFDQLEKSFNLKELYEDGDAYIGLMRWKEKEPFEYWIGVFCPENAVVPEGFEYVDFDEADLGVVWLYGKEHEVYGQEHKCAKACENEGYNIIPDENGAYWFFERYACPRFTTPDEDGSIILDICHYIS